VTVLPTSPFKGDTVLSEMTGAMTFLFSKIEMREGFVFVVIKIKSGLESPLISAPTGPEG
jgi:hypothetical protein